MVLKSVRKEQNFLMRKMKVFTTIFTILAVVAIFVCLGVVGYYVYDIVQNFQVNKPDFDSTDPAEIKKTATIVLDSSEIALKIPSILIAGFSMIGVVFIIRAVSNLLLAIRASYDARTIIKSKKVKVVRIIKYIFSILFAGLACIAFMYVPKHFITEPILGSVNTHIDEVIKTAKDVINAATPTNEQIQALKDAATNLNDIVGKPDSIFNQIQTWEYWQEAIAYLALSGVGIVGLLINQLIFGSISLAMIRHFNPNTPAQTKSQADQAQPESTSNNSVDTQTVSPEEATTTTTTTA